ncbi:unnamed protein product [Ilex paraguariensis]|uniref:Uncharacterized protein n=1 Tax=Ilex paraguariensis TaxID=185542 RepID=A0ABC8T309_9AQUA
MEESEKRRERLRAMRMEANEAGDCNNLGNSPVSRGLSNPLIETSGYATTPGPAESYATPRFDYYTNPGSAFSADKRRSKVSHQNLQQDSYTPPRPRTPEVNFPQAYQAQINYSPDQRVYHQGLYNSSGPYRSPVGMASPSGMPQETPPIIWNGSGGTPGYFFPSNPSGGVNFRSPGFEQRGSPSFNSGQGRWNWVNRSPGPSPGRGGSSGPSSGRGRGRWSGHSGYYGSAHRGGGRSGSHDHVSAEVRPDVYYNKSMVEDPWKFLEPVIWKSLNTPNSSKSWLPKSISMKKARVSEAPKVSSSQPSLAEYLAASFNDAVNDGPST